MPGTQGYKPSGKLELLISLICDKSLLCHNVYRIRSRTLLSWLTTACFQYAMRLGLCSFLLTLDFITIFRSCISKYTFKVVSPSFFIIEKLFQVYSFDGNFFKSQKFKYLHNISKSLAKVFPNKLLLTYFHRKNFHLLKSGWSF